MIPIILRVTVAKDSFKAAEFNLGDFSIPMGWFSIFWGIFMMFILCLPPTYPITVNSFNYSPLVLVVVVAYALILWYCSAKDWFKGAKMVTATEERSELVPNYASPFHPATPVVSRTTTPNAADEIRMRAQSSY